MRHYDLFDDISPYELQRLKEWLGSDNTEEITLNICSPGGDIFVAFGIIDLLRPFKTTANIVGYVASAASIIALSCDKVTITPTGSIMLHSAYVDAVEITDDMDEGVQRANELMLSIIRSRCPSIDASVVSKENWFNADRAKALGLVDEIVTNPDVIGSAVNRYAAKFVGGSMTTKVKAEEVMQEEVRQEEVKEEVKEEEKAPDLIDVVSKLVERCDALEARIAALEVPAEIVEQVERVVPEQDDRIRVIYDSLTKPKASVGNVVAAKGEKEKVVKLTGSMKRLVKEGK